MEKRVAILFFLGFSSGLPIILVFSTLSFWLREAGVSRATIGFASWIGLLYGIKWIWSPLVDRLSLPILSNWLGRRRSWMLLSQVVIMLALAGMAMSDPEVNLAQMIAFAVLVAFASATQDIVIDAFRIEIASERLQAAMAASYMTGYRLAMIVAGAGALTIAAFASESEAYDLQAWSIAYLSMMALMLIGVITCFICHEPEVDQQKTNQKQQQLNAKLAQRGLAKPLVKFSAWVYIALIEPFTDFFHRYKWHALLILALVASYRISDIVMGIMANAFYVDMGYTKGEVAAISKVFGIIMTLVGAGVGGLLLNRYGTMKILFLGALLSAATNLMFAYLAISGKDLQILTLVISLDNLSAGIATAAFITYLSSLTNVAFSATQYALFSSIMLLLPKFVAGFSGVYVDNFGYVEFFISTAAIGIPVLALIMLIGKYVIHEDTPQTESAVAPCEQQG